MKIAFIIPSLDKGGAERVVARLSEVLSIKHEVHLILLQDSIRYSHRGVIHLLQSNGSNPLRHIINTVEVAKLKKKHSFHIVISFLSVPNWMNILTSRKQEKTIISVRNFISREYQHYRNGKLLLKFARMLYKKADAVVSVSEDIKDDLIKNYSVNQEKVVTIYNPYNIEEIECKGCIELDDEIIRWKQGSLLFLNVGRLEFQKNQQDFINIVGKIYEDNYDVKGLIVGSGSMKNQLLEAIASKGLSSRIRLIDFQENPYKYMKLADVYLLTSFYEGFPNVLVEAMINRCAIVASDCKTGPREILCLNPEENKFGFRDFGILFNDLYVETGVDEEALANIKKLISDPQLLMAMKEKAYNGAARFSVDRIIQLWERIIDGRL